MPKNILTAAQKLDSEMFYVVQRVTHFHYCRIKDSGNDFKTVDSVVKQSGLVTICFLFLSCPWICHSLGFNELYKTDLNCNYIVIVIKHNLCLITELFKLFLEDFL